MTDTYYLGWDDLKSVPAGTLPPYGYRELVPGSGVAVPDPATNRIHPGWFKPNQMPEHPIDLANMQILRPGDLGQWGYRELIPNSGVWIADAAIGAGPGGPGAPKKPLDMGRMKFVPPGALLPWGYGELIPGSGVCLPAADLPPRGGTMPAAHHGTAGDTDASGVFEVDYRQLEHAAKAHDEHANTVADWAKADPGFPERFLATHGAIAYPTYLQLKEHADSRQAQGAVYADRQAHTADALRTAVRVIDGVDTTNASNFAGPTQLT